MSKSKRAEKRLARVVTYLTRHPWSTAKQIATGVHLAVATVRPLLALRAVIVCRVDRNLTQYASRN